MAAHLAAPVQQPAPPATSPAVPTFDVFEVLLVDHVEATMGATLEATHSCASLDEAKGYADEFNEAELADPVNA